MIVTIQINELELEQQLPQTSSSCQKCNIYLRRHRVILEGTDAEFRWPM